MQAFPPRREISPTSPAQAWHIAQGLGLPVVVKPLDGNRARGVSLDLMDQASVETAWQLAKREGTQVLVERCIRGYEHRVLVVGDLWWQPPVVKPWAWWAMANPPWHNWWKRRSTSTPAA